MPTAVFDASLITQRLSNKAQAKSFFTRMDNSKPTYGPLLGDYSDSAAINASLGKQAEFRRNDACNTVNYGCPCQPIVEEQAPVCNIGLTPYQLSVIDGSGNYNDVSYDITNDSEGNVYYVGRYTSNTSIPLKNLDGSTSSYSLPLTGIDTSAGYIVKYDTLGNIALQITFKGNTADATKFTEFRSIVVDSLGYIYVGGKYFSNTSITLASGVSLSGTIGGLENAMTICYNSNGIPVWASSVQSRQASNITSIVNNANSILSYGTYADISGVILQNIPSKTLLATDPSGNTSAFVISYNSTSSLVNWAISLGSAGSYNQSNFGPLKFTTFNIITDNDNNFYLCGSYRLTRGTGYLPAVLNIYNKDNNANIYSPYYLSSTGASVSGVPDAATNGFVIKYNSSGNVQWRIVLGANRTTLNNAQQNIIISNLLINNNILYVIGAYNLPITPTNMVIDNKSAVPSSYTLTPTKSTSPILTYNQFNGFVIQYTNDADIVSSFAIFNTNATDTNILDTTLYGILPLSIITDSNNNIYLGGTYRVNSATISNILQIPNLNGIGTSERLPDCGISPNNTILSNSFIIKYTPSGIFSKFLITYTNGNPVTISPNVFGSNNFSLFVNENGGNCELYSANQYYALTFGNFQSNIQSSYSLQFPGSSSQNTSAGIVKII